MTTVLVANRGEIAIRVFRTARAMGYRSVAIYTDTDATAPHVLAADAAVRVESYLDVEEVVRAAQSAGADIVHPGYGFLSERAAFARALENAKITLAGPSALVMEQMGRKDAAREIAVAAGVPVVPSYDGTDDPDSFDFPVLVKAAAGGGGKGMRVVRASSEFHEAVEAARREAAASFGDDTMLIEKYVESGRHLEVQVMGDLSGNVIHLWERDCSTQRRHQKVLEEAPAPTIDAATRTRLTDAAVALARKVGYVSAGTVEFLLDTATDDFYFLEMNTRLQVEHPVTESITGLDLVELQLRVAGGEDLSIAQDDVRSDGWAIEARVYAEDSFGGFLPQAGTVSVVHWPQNARVDHALEDGQVISTAYDPMLGKVIAHGPDREEARRRLVAALDDTAILGLTTNTGFLRTLVASSEFRDATIDTAWLDRTELSPPCNDVARAVGAWVVTARSVNGGPAGPLQADGFRLSSRPAPIQAQLDRPVHVDRQQGTADGVPVIQLVGPQNPVVLDVAGQRLRAVVDSDAHCVEVVVQGQRSVFYKPDVRTGGGPLASEGSLIAPMPGTVLVVDVAPGDIVEKGQRLGVLEAMKMELAVRSPHGGTVRAAAAVVGEQVKIGALLFEVDPHE